MSRKLTTEELKELTKYPRFEDPISPSISDPANMPQNN